MAILDQFGLNYTFFIQFALIAIVFFVLSHLYFKPFLQLFEARHKRTVEDREAAERLMTQAQERMDEYSRRLGGERSAARKEIEAAIQQAKSEESSLLSAARGEAKKITQECLHAITQQRMKLKAELEADVESLARAVSEQLLSKRD